MKTVKITLGISVILAFIGLNEAMGQWATSGSNIYNTNAGNVGIGNNTPSTLLYVAKNMTEPTITVQNLGGSGGATFRMTDIASGADWKFKSTNTGGFKIRDHANGLDIFTIESNSSANVLYINGAGNVGIGTVAPTAKLEVVSDAKFNGVVVGKGSGSVSDNTAVGNAALGLTNIGGGNSAFGYGALNNNTSGGYNTAIGRGALLVNTTGVNNTGIGSSALYHNNGNDNTAIGQASLFDNTSGFSNTGLGAGALYSNQDGNWNTAVGAFSLLSSISATHNTAVGSYALYASLNGFNTAIGADALKLNSSGAYNTATGAFALVNNNGNSNTGYGYNTLATNSSGSNNTAFGTQALNSNLANNDNTAIGFQALYNAQAFQNTSVGSGSLINNIQGYGNTALGKNTGLTNVDGFWNTFIGLEADGLNSIHNSTAIGHDALALASDQVMIGASNISTIGGYKSWTTFPSDQRFKKNVDENVPGLAFINELQPVTYNIDVTAIDQFLQKNLNQTETEKTPSPELIELEKASRFLIESVVYSGFIAQDVETAAKNLGYDFSGVDAPKNENAIYGLRYAEFTVPLVKAVQELDAKAIAQQMKIDEQQQLIEELLLRIERLENR